MSTQQKLVFDIETIGIEFNSFDAISQEYLLKYAENDEEARQTKEQLGFSPLTGEIIAIGVLNPDTDQGRVYVRTDNSELNNTEAAPGISVETGTEKEIIEKFWETATHYNQFISFNGRGFDAPFIMIRSAVLEIRPSKNLMSNRYTSMQKFDAVHIDLYDQLSFYGAVRKKFNLHFWTKTFGIQSPKESGITGDDMGRLYKEKKYAEIAKYNAGDLKATKSLYEKWNSYLNF